MVFKNQSLYKEHINQFKLVFNDFYNNNKDTWKINNIKDDVTLNKEKDFYMFILNNNNVKNDFIKIADVIYQEVKNNLTKLSMFNTFLIETLHNTTREAYIKAINNNEVLNIKPIDYKVEYVNNYDFNTTLLRELKNKKSFELFCDYETGVYNKSILKEKPTLVKGFVLTFQISYLNSKGDVITTVFNNFNEFKQLLELNLDDREVNINLNFHNGNRFDNFYLLWELLNTNNYKQENLLLPKLKVVLNGEKNKTDIKSLQNDLVYTSYIKSGTNLSLSFKIKNLTFNTVDTVLKQPMSLEEISYMIHKQGYLQEKHMKTDFDYAKYHFMEDYTQDEIAIKSNNLYNNLTPDELEYCINDVIILARFYKWFKEVKETQFIKWENLTQTMGAVNEATYSDEAKYILTNKANKFIVKDPESIKYSNINLNGIKLTDFIRLSYKGGYTDFNDKYLGKEVNDMFSIDINSSYPYVMYDKPLPTILKKVKYNKEIKASDMVKFNDKYYFIHITNDELTNIINKSESEVLKQTFLKHYFKLGYSFQVLDSVKVLTLIKQGVLNKDYVFNCNKFVIYGCKIGVLKDFLEKNYLIKQQAKNDVVLDISNGLTDIKLTDKPYNDKLPDVEVAIAKMIINSIYGASVMREAFDVFLLNDNGELERHGKELINSERNNAYGTGITSWAFHNLLEPFTSLTPKQIDDVFVYCDTDSLYLKQYTTDFNNNVVDVKTQIQQVISFDSNNLGAWDVENNNILKFYIFNNKQYIYITEGKKGLKTKFKYAGLPNKTQKETCNKINIDNFTDEVKLIIDSSFITNRSIKNADGVIVIINDSEIKPKKALTKKERAEIILSRKVIEIQAIYKKHLSKIEYEITDDDEITFDTHLGSFGVNEMETLLENDFDLDKTIINNNLIDNTESFIIAQQEAYNKILELKNNSDKLKDLDNNELVKEYITSIKSYDKTLKSIKFIPNSLFAKNQKLIQNLEIYTDKTLRYSIINLLKTYKLKDLKILIKANQFDIINNKLIIRKDTDMEQKDFKDLPLIEQILYFRDSVKIIRKMEKTFLFKPGDIKDNIKQYKLNSDIEFFKPELNLYNKMVYIATELGLVKFRKLNQEQLIDLLELKEYFKIKKELKIKKKVGNK